ncbi:MAG TPA: DNA polymerase III subunit delta' [Clostridiaceae bacterium]|nr:DNA polymerase III subunit delta' [Clostridiaceae bacterium]
MDFSDIVGQKEIVESLKNKIASGRVGHAYIFSGPKGIGKKTMARIFAGLLLCEEGSGGRRCGKCMPCRLFDSGSNPDFREINPADASIKIDDIRDMQSDIIIRPLYSDRKVYLIVDADRMTEQAQNCLLKTLEEPPSYAVIILTSSNNDALLETILSRAANYSFRKNTPEEVKEFLKSKNIHGNKPVDFIVSYADGIIGTAVELADSDEFTTIREKTIDLVIKLSDSKLASIFNIYKFFDENKSNIETILNIMVLFYRDLIIAKKEQFGHILINSDKKDIILDNARRFSLRKLLDNIEAVETAHKNLKQNANYQLTIEVMLMKIQEE